MRIDMAMMKNIYINKSALLTLTRWVSQFFIVASFHSAFATELVYVANAGDDNVNIIDGNSDSVIPPLVSVGNSPFAIAVTPDWNYAYVTNESSNNVTVIDLISNIAIASVEGLDSPRGIVANPVDPYMYVANYGGNSVSVINTNDYTVSTVVTLGLSSPYAITILPNNTYYYIAGLSTGIVTIYNASNNTFHGTVSIAGLRGHGICATPDSAWVYVSGRDGENYGHVVVIDTTTNTVNTTIDMGNNLYGIAANPQGGHVYVTDNSDGNYLWAIEVETNTPVASVFLGTGYIMEVAVSPDGNTAFVSDVGNNFVYPVGLPSMTLLDSPIAVGNSPIGLAVIELPQPNRGSAPLFHLTCRQAKNLSKERTVPPFVRHRHP